MNLFRNLRSGLILALALGISSLPSLAQTIKVNGNGCAGATVKFGSGSIDIDTTSCSGSLTAPTITSGAPPASGNVGAAYNFTFSASGSNPITWTVSSGALPGGVTLSSGGVLSGTPTAAGTFNFAVTAANGTAPNAVSPASGSHTITIANLPVITSALPINPTLNAVYTHTFVPSQAITTWSVSTGTLPPGLGLNSSGVLSGTPNVAGSYPFTVSAMNGNGTAMQSVTMNVAAPTAPTVTSSAPTATGNVGTPYTFTFAANGTAPITWTVSTGALPGGLTLSSAGVLSGTPTATGAFTFAVTAANGVMPNAVSPAAGSHTITISAAASGGIVATDGTVPVNPSKMANNSGVNHPGEGGGGFYPNKVINGYSIPTSHCANATPAITKVWYHNIDLADYGYQQAIDYFEFAPNQAVVYAFTPPLTMSGLGQIYIAQGPNGTPATTYVSISASPCDLPVSKIAATTACYTSVPTENGFTFNITNSPVPGQCTLTPGVTYYINLRWQNAVSSPNLDSCASQNASTCGALLKIRKF